MLFSHTTLLYHTTVKNIFIASVSSMAGTFNYQIPTMNVFVPVLQSPPWLVSLTWFPIPILIHPGVHPFWLYDHQVLMLYYLLYYGFFTKTLLGLGVVQAKFKLF